MNNEFEIMWKGNLPITALEWEFDTTKQIAFTQELEEKIKEFWIRAVKQHPKMYDGTLLCVHGIAYQSEKISLQIGFIHFSSVYYHYENKKPLEGTYGSLGFQAVIYNPTRTHILIGRRVKTSEYKPGFYAHPGGILEKNDMQGTITEACLREIKEETSLEVKNETFRIRAIFRDDQEISTGILVEVETKEELDASENERLLTTGNEEWEKNELIWYPVTRVKELAKEQTLEGLTITINEEQ
jgi:ADP-ribose pyrophosphatase YjhB (NUDIX family)